MSLIFTPVHDTGRALLLALGLLLMLACTLGQQAQAATFTALEPNTDRCLVRMSGEIVAGDVERMQHAFQELQEIRSGVDVFDFERRRLMDFSGLCLDSPGGSYLEAIRIIDAMQGDMATVIPQDAQCLSACALIFMAGGFRVENDGSVLARVMHVTGRLGFHAPGLVVPEGNYTAAHVNRAYLLSVRAIAELVSRKVQIGFPDTLLAEMLKTPPTPETFFYVDTVAKAARWDITISGVRPPEQVTPRIALNTCMNSAVESLAAQASGMSIPYGLSPFGTGNSLTLNDDGDRITGQLGIGNEAGAWGCEFSYRRGHDIFDWVDYDYYSSDLAGGRFGPALFYRPETRLADIAAGAAPTPYPDPPAQRAERTCFVLRGQTLTDKDPCIEENRRFLDERLQLTAQTTYTWPSGAKTLISDVETGPFESRHQINGAPIKDSFFTGPYGDSKRLYDLIGETFCRTNAQSGNTFCHTQ